MSDAEKIETEFVKTIRPFFSSERTVSITAGHDERDDVVTCVRAFVNIKGTDVRIFCDEVALLKKISGEAERTVVGERNTKVVIKGQFEERDCRVTITCTPHVDSEAH